jgi:hypothetical protein
MVSVSLWWRGALGELFWIIQIHFLKIHNTIPLKRQRQLIPQTITIIITFFAPGFHPPFFTSHVNYNKFVFSVTSTVFMPWLEHRCFSEDLREHNIFSPQNIHPNICQDTISNNFFHLNVKDPQRFYSNEGLSFFVRRCRCVTWQNTLFWILALYKVSVPKRAYSIWVVRFCPLWRSVEHPRAIFFKGRSGFKNKTIYVCESYFCPPVKTAYCYI